MGDDGRESECGEQSIMMVWILLWVHKVIACDARNLSKCYKDVPKKEHYGKEIQIVESRRVQVETYEIPMKTKMVDDQ